MGYYVVPRAIPLNSASSNTHISDYNNYLNGFYALRSNGHFPNNMYLSYVIWQNGAAAAPKNLKYRGSVPSQRMNRFLRNPSMFSPIPFWDVLSTTVLTTLPLAISGTALFFGSIKICLLILISSPLVVLEPLEPVVLRKITKLSQDVPSLTPSFFHHLTVSNHQLSPRMLEKFTLLSKVTLMLPSLMITPVDLFSTLMMRLALLTSTI